MSAEASATILKALLFNFIDRPFIQVQHGDGFFYRKGILDCIHELTGEDREEVLEEVKSRVYLDQATMSAIVKRWREGVSHEDLIKEFGITPNQLGQLGFGT